MILLTTCRFIDAKSFPGGRSHRVISTESDRDKRDFVMEYDPRLRIVFVTVQQRTLGIPTEQVESMEFDAESFRAFRDATTPTVKAALDARRQAVAAAK